MLAPAKSGVVSLVPSMSRAPLQVVNGLSLYCPDVYTRNSAVSGALSGFKTMYLNSQ
jgi:hypothetical protein